MSLPKPPIWFKTIRCKQFDDQGVAYYSEGCPRSAEECWFTHPEDPEWAISEPSHKSATSSSRSFRARRDSDYDRDRDDRFHDNHGGRREFRKTSSGSGKEYKEHKYAHKDSHRYRSRSRSRSISSDRSHRRGSSKSNRVRESTELSTGKSMKEAISSRKATTDNDIESLSPVRPPQSMREAEITTLARQELESIQSSHAIPPPPSSVPPPKPLPEIPAELILDAPSPLGISTEKKTEVWAEKVNLFVTSVEALVNLSESQNEIVNAERLLAGQLPDTAVKSIEEQLKTLQNRRRDAQKVWGAAVERLLASDSWPAYPPSEERQKLDKEYIEMVACVRQLKATAVQLKEAVDKLHRDDESPGFPDPTAMIVDGEYGPARPPVNDNVDDRNHPTPLQQENVLNRITGLEINYTTMTDYYDDALLKENIKTMTGDQLEQLKQNVHERLDHALDRLNFGALEDVISTTQEEMHHLTKDVEAVDRESKALSNDTKSVNEEHSQWKQAFTTMRERLTALSRSREESVRALDTLEASLEEYVSSPRPSHTPIILNAPYIISVMEEPLFEAYRTLIQELIETLRQEIGKTTSSHQIDVKKGTQLKFEETAKALRIILIKLKLEQGK